MSENKKFPGPDQDDPKGTERQTEETDISNDLSAGGDGSAEVSDLNPEKEDQEREGEQAGGGSGDDNRSADNGVNPLPGEVDPQKKALNNDLDIENADEDELNKPYPDGLKPDEDDKINSTWMISGQNWKI